MGAKRRTILTDLRWRFEALYTEWLVQMALFGSPARGDSEPGSDYFWRCYSTCLIGFLV
jgi:predicted nucleotidyltransferase